MMDIHLAGLLLTIICGGLMATAWQSPGDDDDALPFSGIENRLFTLLMDGEYDKLLLILKQLLTDNPHDNMIYTYLSQVYTGLKDEIGEEDALLEITNICDDKVLNGYYLYTEFLLGEGRYEEVYDLLVQGISMFNQEADLYYFYGIALFHLEWEYEAIEAFSHAIFLDDNRDEYYFFRGKTHELANEFDAALEDFTIAIDMHATGVRYATRADLQFYHYGDAHSALSDYKQAITLGNTHCLNDFKACKEAIGRDYVLLFSNWQNLRRDTALELGQQVLDHFPTPTVQTWTEAILTQLQQEEYEEQRFWVEYLPQGNEVYQRAYHMSLAQDYAGAFWLLHKETSLFKKKQTHPFIYHKIYNLLDECFQKAWEVTKYKEA